MQALRQERKVSKAADPQTPELLRCKRRADIGRMGLPEAKPASVTRRNARERNRVKLVNQGFETLREHVPNGKKNRKMSKVETLRSAVEYIRHMQQLLQENDVEIKKISLDTCSDNEDDGSPIAFDSIVDTSTSDVSPTTSVSSSDLMDTDSEQEVGDNINNNNNKTLNFNFNNNNNNNNNDLNNLNALNLLTHPLSMPDLKTHSFALLTLPIQTALPQSASDDVFLPDSFLPDNDRSLESAEKDSPRKILPVLSTMQPSLCAQFGMSLVDQRYGQQKSQLYLDKSQTTEEEAAPEMEPQQQQSQLQQQQQRQHQQLPPHLQLVTSLSELSTGAANIFLPDNDRHRIQSMLVMQHHHQQPSMDQVPSPSFSTSSSQASDSSYEYDTLEEDLQDLSNWITELCSSQDIQSQGTASFVFDRLFACPLVDVVVFLLILLIY